MTTSSARPATGRWRRFIAWFALPGSSGRQERLRLQQLEAEARARPHDERVLIALAKHHEGTGDIEAATQRFWQAAQLFSSTGHHAKALAVMQQTLNLNPRALFVSQGLAQTLERLGRNFDAARLYRNAAHLADEDSKAEEAVALRARADILSPRVPAKRTPTIIRDLIVPEPLPASLPRSPLAEALATPVGTGGLDKPADEGILEEPVAPKVQPSWSTMLEEPVLPVQPNAPVAQANDAPKTQLRAPGPAPLPKKVDDVVAVAMANAFGKLALERRASAPDLNPAVQDLIRDTVDPPATTELALDAELFLLAGDAAEVSTTQCSPQEVHQIRTKTLLHQAEQELQVLLTGDAPTGEMDMLGPGSFA